MCSIVCSKYTNIVYLEKNGEVVFEKDIENRQAPDDAPLRGSDGICAETPEDCIRNMAQIGNQGMAQTDKEIIHIMESKK